MTELAWTLAQLAAEAGVGSRLEGLSRLLDLAVAPRADASATDLVRALPSGPFVHERVIAAIGQRFVRATPTHPMPPVDDLPVVWTFLGLRPTESTETLATLLTPRVPGRIALTGGDVAVALGHARAAAHRAAELRSFPEPTPGWVNGGGPPGDINRDGQLDLADVDLLCAALRTQAVVSDALDLNRDQRLDPADLQYLIETLLDSTFGDANLDGLFNSRDFVLIFQAGQYEDNLVGNSTWTTGDWNCDG